MTHLYGLKTCFNCSTDFICNDTDDRFCSLKCRQQDERIRQRSAERQKPMIELLQRTKPVLMRMLEEEADPQVEQLIKLIEKIEHESD